MKADTSPPTALVLQSKKVGPGTGTVSPGRSTARPGTSGGVVKVAALRRKHTSITPSGSRNPWWDRVDTVDGIMGAASKLKPGGRVLDKDVSYTELVTRCATVRKNAKRDLQHLNRSHSAWIDDQLKWEERRHSKLYAAYRDTNALMPEVVPEVTIGENRIVYSSLFLSPRAGGGGVDE